MSKVTEQVESIIQPVLDDLNFELVEVEYTKEGKDYFLRVSIDKEGGVDLNDCALASEKISEVMDEEDPIQEMYYLDVASPGAERPIKKEKDFQNAVSKPIYVSLYAPIEGGKEWLGILKEVTSETIIMEVKKNQRRNKLKFQEIKSLKHVML